MADIPPPPYSARPKEATVQWWADNGASFEAAYIRRDERELDRLASQIFPNPARSNVDLHYHPLDSHFRLAMNVAFAAMFLYFFIVPSILAMGLCQVLDWWSLLTLPLFYAIIVLMTGEWMKYRHERYPTFTQMLIKSMMVYTVTALDLTSFLNLGLQVLDYYAPFLPPRTRMPTAAGFFTAILPYLTLRLIIYWGPTYFGRDVVGWSDVHPIMRGYVDEMTIYWYMPARGAEESDWAKTLKGIRQLRKSYARE